MEHFLLNILIATCNYLLDIFHQLENRNIILIDTLICQDQAHFTEMNTFCDISIHLSKIM